VEFSDVIQLLRVKQWIKNTFVLMPAFFAGVLSDQNLLVSCGIAFLSFSFIASSVYIINDYADRKRDLNHPKKKERPIAAGRIKPAGALLLLIGCLSFGLTGGIYLGVWPLSVLLGYCLMNILYSFWLKHVPIVDITVIAIGFVLRVFLGGLAVSVELSHWLIIMTFLLALILALAKRRGEFINQNDQRKSREVLSGYNLGFIDVTMVMIAAITIVCYVMYTISEEVVDRLGTNYLYLTTIFVLLGILRYLQQTLVFSRTESPTRFLYRDRFLQLVLIGWLASFAVLLYFR